MPAGQPYDVPILFIIFNRPDTARVVLARLRELKPTRLFIAADGPRPGNASDAARCAQVREETLKAIDWDCEVKTLLRESNLGCRKGVATAIDWFFENVEQGIILEDDCLPDPSFFPFCREMLERYRDDERVMHVSGDNFQDGRKVGGASYYFSRYNHVWGWATWRRAWQHYDLVMKTYPEFRQRSMFAGVWSDADQRRYWRRIFDRAHAGAVNTWDYQWEYAILAQNGLCILPNVNLISNIGFGADATHTTGASDVADLGTKAISFPLTHPAIMAPDAEADRRTHYKIFYVSPARKVLNRLAALLKLIRR